MFGCGVGGNITTQGDWSPGFGVLGPRYWHQLFGLKPNEAGDIDLCSKFLGCFQVQQTMMTSSFGRSSLFKDAPSSVGKQNKFLRHRLGVGCEP